jgi:hypothetical protein
MHDIKKKFSIKLIRQSGGQKKISERDKLPKTLPKNIIFQNPEGELLQVYIGSAPNDDDNDGGQC